MGEPDWARDAKYRSAAGRVADADRVEAQLGEWTQTRDDYEVMNACRAAGLAAGVVQNTEDMYRRDDQLRERGFFETIPHWKRGEVVATGIPLGLRGTPGRTTQTGSSIGHDNDYVFREILGLSQDEIDRLTEQGAIEARR